MSSLILLGSSGFNSRSREGSDLLCVYTLGDSKNVSIHAPARGATATSFYSTLRLLGFNSRSREGSDKGVLDRILSGDKFQFTLPRGERPRRSSPRSPM